MTGSEKFDKVTSLIESEIKKYKPTPEIAKKVEQDNGILERDLNAVFLFTTGKTLYQYIKERKMNASYECLISSDKRIKEAIQDAISLSGLSDQPTFDKKFKKIFGMTPTEAYNKKDGFHVTMRLTWENCSHIEIEDITEENNSKVSRKNSVFGLIHSKYEEVKEAIELQELYGFDELQSGIAYYIHQTYGYPLKETFRFVDEYEYDENDNVSFDDMDEDMKELLGKYFTDDMDDDTDDDRMSREEYYNHFAKGDADDPEIRYAYFDVGITSTFAIYHLIDKLHALGDNDITELEPELIKMCAYDDFDARYCKKAVAYYLEKATDEYGDDAFEEYVGYLLNGQYIEDAFDNIWHTEGWDDYETDCTYHSMEEFNRELKEYDQDDPFEKWAEEETDYSDKY